MQSGFEGKLYDEVPLVNAFDDNKQCMHCYGLFTVH